VRKEIRPVYQPEKRQGKQGAEDDRQQREKPDLLLMPGQNRLSPASGVVWHNFSIMPRHGAIAMGCSPQQGTRANDE
jgi:hypothetical protein